MICTEAQSMHDAKAASPRVPPSTLFLIPIVIPATISYKFFSWQRERLDVFSFWKWFKQIHPTAMIACVICLNTKCRTQTHHFFPELCFAQGFEIFVNRHTRLFRSHLITNRVRREETFGKVTNERRPVCAIQCFRNLCSRNPTQFASRIHRIHLWNTWQF